MISIGNVMVTFSFLLGQLFALLDCIFTIISGKAKTKKKMLALQVINCICAFFADLCLGGFSGSSTAVIAGIRNVLIYNGKSGKVLTIIFCLALLVAGLLVNSNGWAGLLPVAASIEYTIVLFNKKASLKTMKKALLVNTIGWLAFEIIILGIPYIILFSIEIVFLGYELYLKDDKEHHLAK